MRDEDFIAKPSNPLLQTSTNNSLQLFQNANGSKVLSALPDGENPRIADWFADNSNSIAEE